jgi:hypothetical protein
MKNLLSNALAGRILSVCLVVSIPLAFGNMAAAADKNTQPSNTGNDQALASVCDDHHDGPSRWKDNLRLDEVDILEAQVYVGNTCYTPYGSCWIANGPLPVGAPCWCPSVYGPVAGAVGTP